MGQYIPPEELWRHSIVRKNQQVLSPEELRRKIMGSVEEYDDFDEPQQEGVFSYFGNLAKYVVKALLPWNDPYIKELGFIKGAEAASDVFAEGARQFGRDILKTGGDIISYFRDTPLDQVPKDAWDSLVKAPLKGVSEVSLPGIIKGLGDFLIETPLEAISSTQNLRGEVSVATPQQQADALKGVVSAAVMMYGYHIGTKGFLASLPKGPLARLETSPIKQIGQAAIQSAKGSLAGGVPGAVIANVGEDDFAAKVATTALSAVPLGIVLGTPFEFLRISKARATNAAAAREIEIQTDQELASAKGLGLSKNKTLQESISDVEYLSSSDNLTEAVVKSVVANRQSWIVPDVSEARVNEILSGVITPSEVRPALDYTNPPRALKLSKPTYKGVGIEWGSQFDKSAYILSNLKSKAKNYQVIMDDVVKTFGIKPEDVIAHGNFVREVIRTKITNGELKRLGQPEIDAITNRMRAQGEKNISSLPENGNIQDYAGRVWVKQGNVLRHNELAYPLDDRTIQITLGRDPRTPVDPTTGKLEIPTLEFRPDYMRVVGDFHIYKHKRVDVTQVSVPSPIQAQIKYDLLISPEKLKPVHSKFFEQTGYLPGEIVSLDGRTNVQIIQRGHKPNTFMVSSVRGGKKQLVHENRLLHNAGSLRKAVKGLQAFEATPESVFEKFVDEFISDYKKFSLLPDDELKQSFDKVFHRTRLRAGIPEEQAEALRIATYRRLQDDLISSLPDDEAIVVKALRKEMWDLDVDIAADKANLLYTFTEGNGLYTLNKGGGAFEIRQLVDNELVGTYSSIDDALKSLHRQFQNPLYDLVNDGSAPIPTALADLGGLATPWEGPIETALGRKLDRLAISPVGGIITPSQDFLHALSNVVETQYKIPGIRVKVADAVRISQEAARLKRLYGEVVLKPLSPLWKELYQKTLRMSKERKNVVLGYIEAMTEGEIISKFISRRANELEINTATKIAQDLSSSNVSVFDVSGAMRAARQVGEFGSQNYEVALQKMVKDGVNVGGRTIKVKPQVASVATELGKLISNPNLRPGTFSPELVLRLADAKINPDQAINRTVFAARNSMTIEELKVAKLFENVLKKAAEIAEIPQERIINAYVPHVRLTSELSSWANMGLPEEFSRGLARVMLGDNMSMVRDPATLAYLYLDQVASYKTKVNVAGKEINYNKAINAVENMIDEIATEINSFELKSTGEKMLGDAFFKKAHQYLGELRGDLDAGTRIRRYMEKFAGKLGFPEKLGADAFVQITGMATQGGRPYMGARDFVSAAKLSYTLFGKEFTRKAIFTPVSKKVVDALERQGKFPIVGSSELLAPSSTRVSSEIGGVLARQSDIAMALSGQHYIYRQRMAGIYIATKDLVSNVLPKIRDRVITKKAGYEQIHLDVHPPAVTELFDRFASSGDIQGAIDFLALQNIKRVMNLYGYANSPIGWSSSVGRLLGQYGSWGANNVATAMNANRNLFSWRGAQRMLRYSAVETATILAGKAAGVDLGTWLINPFTTYPNVGPVIALANDFSRAAQALSSQDESRVRQGISAGTRLLPFTTGTEIARLYIPYSYALRDLLVGGFKMPAEGYDPIQSALKMFGFKPTEQR